MPDGDLDKHSRSDNSTDSSDSIETIDMSTNQSNTQNNTGNTSPGTSPNECTTWVLSRYRLRTPSPFQDPEHGSPHSQERDGGDGQGDHQACAPSSGQPSPNESQSLASSPGHGPGQQSDDWLEFESAEHRRVEGVALSMPVHLWKCPKGLVNEAGEFLHAISMQFAPGLPHLIIHETRAENSPQFATISLHRTTTGGHASEITILSGAGVRHRHRELKVLIGSIDERRVRFSIETDASGHHQETFEWRHSWGPEVRVTTRNAQSGWKLVRLGKIVTHVRHHQPHSRSRPPPRAALPAPPSANANGSVSPRFLPEPPIRVFGASKRDGSEVVAAFCMNPPHRAQEVFSFRLIGSGADGTLGTQWCYLALFTALGMWTQRNRRKIEFDGLPRRGNGPFWTAESMERRRSGEPNLNLVPQLPGGDKRLPGAAGLALAGATGR
ncbi:hypothetical protein F5Y16DRAFT_419754 [Xylariaceae sp. FL0255]|nr:hypothetical protein F5Y16DRAFT_419754 [Xylariaceae sp. FL0255]